ncbi:MAG: class I SAM-dependent methyltransferase [Myxococcota bacterium]
MPIALHATRLATALAIAVSLCGGCSREDAAESGDRNYEFATDWFSSNIPHWKRFLKPYMGKPDLRYLEIGVFEGRSAVWMVENVLTEPSSELVAIDIFTVPPDLEERYRANLERSGFKGKAVTIKGRSQQMLQALPLASFDIIYVDGSHTLDDVFTDMVLSWELLKIDGIMILDDYRWKWQLAEDLKPKGAIDAFLNAFWKRVQIVHNGYQLVIRKKPSLCARTLENWQCTPFGEYLYLWNQKALFHRDFPNDKIELSEAEVARVEEIIDARGFGDLGLSLPEPALVGETLTRLVERLDLKLNGRRIVKFH